MWTLMNATFKVNFVPCNIYIGSMQFLLPCNIDFYQCHIKYMHEYLPAFNSQFVFALCGHVLQSSVTFHMFILCISNIKLVDVLYCTLIIFALM